jgi:hypothetical protein
MDDTGFLQSVAVGLVGVRGVLEMLKTSREWSNITRHESRVTADLTTACADCSAPSRNYYEVF